jgi:hypothetical protein
MSLHGVLSGVVQVRDAFNGGWVTQMQFVGKDWEVQSITSLDFNNDGRDEIAVFATSDDGRSAGVQIRNAESKAQVNWVGFPVD